MTFRTQLWLKQALTLNQAWQIDAVLRELGLAVSPLAMKREVANQIVPRFPTHRFAVDVMLQLTKSALIRDTLQTWRDEFVASADEYVTYSWTLTVNPAHLIITLPNDDWRQDEEPYDVRILISYDNFSPKLFSVSSVAMLDQPLVNGAVEAFGWLPISQVMIYADRPDKVLCGYLAWHILDIAGAGLLHPLRRSSETSTLAQLHPLAERGEFPGKIFAISHTHRAMNGPKTYFDHFMDADFLAAWLENPNFGLS